MTLPARLPAATGQVQACLPRDTPFDTGSPRPDRRRRVLIGGSDSFPAATSRAVGTAVTFYGAGIREGRFGLPLLIALAPSCRRRGSAATETSTRRSRPTRWNYSPSRRRPTAPERDRPLSGRTTGSTEMTGPSVHPTVAADAWQRLLAWFESHLRAEASVSPRRRERPRKVIEAPDPRCRTMGFPGARSGGAERRFARDLIGDDEPADSTSSSSPNWRQMRRDAQGARPTGRAPGNVIRVKVGDA